MPARRKCSEWSPQYPACAKFLPEYSRRTTCSDACRQRRRNRLARAKTKAGNQPLPEHFDVMNAPVNNRPGENLLREVAKEELRPIVREAITEEVLEAAAQLVGLTPLMVAAIKMDLESDDATIRQRAYSVVARYTLGNASIAPNAENAPPAVTVSFNIPRPSDQPEASDAPPPDAEVVEDDHTCAGCDETKPQSEFVGLSDRCRACQAALDARVAERFG